MPGIRKGLNARWLPPLAPRWPLLVEMAMAADSAPPDRLPPSARALSSLLLSSPPPEPEEALSLSAGVAELQEEEWLSEVDEAPPLAAVVVVETTAEEEGDEEELGWGGGGVCDIIAPTLNMACCEIDAPCGMPWSIMGNMLSPFLASSDPPEEVPKP